MACPECKKHLETIRELGATLHEIRYIIQKVYDRPSTGGRSIADRGFRSS